MKRLLILLTLAALILGGGYWYMYVKQPPPVNFRTAQVEQGDLLATISATGTIEPEEVVDVGAQVAGQIVSFGPDPRGGSKTIDFGSPVDKDTVLAQIDPALYQAQFDAAQGQYESAQAELEQARATLNRSIADLGQMKAKYNQAARDWDRAQQLLTRKSIADVDYDTAKANAETTKAALAVGEATIDQSKAALKDAQANVKKAKAALATAQKNLDYCTIKSPVKGVIIDRRVNIGQTVVSALNAPSLFLIAKDLKRLQVWASVNEADIGNVHSGQQVTFTVDAYPGRTFTGVVAPDQPRLNASMNQNVVTYTVVVVTDNSDGKLKPYQTANLQFVVDKHPNVLKVPNSALRWKPSPQLVVPEARQDYITQMRMRKGQGGGQPAPAAGKVAHNQGTLWVQDGNFVRPVKVKTGLSDGIVTEILSGNLRAGDTVVVGENRGGGNTGAQNPFTPKLFNQKK